MHIATIGTGTSGPGRRVRGSARGTGCASRRPTHPKGERVAVEVGTAAAGLDGEAIRIDDPVVPAIGRPAVAVQLHGRGPGRTVAAPRSPR